MNYQYIVLAGNDDTHTAQRAALREMGMECHVLQGAARVFVSRKTPSLLIPGHGVVIGHLFSRHGQQVTQGQLSTQYAGYMELEKHLLENYWGEYILVHASDANGKELHILRSPSDGIPCVYSFNGGAGFATSNVSIAEFLDLYRKQIDWDCIAHVLTFTYLRTVRTALLGINELLPGCSLNVRETSAHTRLAWSPWKFIAPDYRHHDPGEAAACVRDAVTTAVKAWAETDGDILLQLSGGLDSSIVAACLRGVNARVVCCTMNSPVPGTDERQYAKQMTDFLGVDLQSLEISFERALFDFPVPPDSVTPGMGILHYAVDDVLATAADTHQVNSFFSGDGGDSVFCYLRNASPAADAFKEHGFAAGVAAVRNLSALHQCPLSEAGRLTLKKLMRGPKAPWKLSTSLIDPSHVAATLDMHPWFDAPNGTLPGDQEKVRDIVGSHSFREGMTRGIRRPMRFPLLSQPVMEACLRVPTWMWILRGRNRSIARAAFEDVLPERVLNRRSKGTYMNYCGSLYARKKMKMREFLATGQLQSQGFLDLNALDTFAATELSPRDLSFMRVFELCMVENWLRCQA